MLKQDCEETRTNRMKLTEFEPEVVETFFGFIKRGKKIYDKRLTLDLLRHGFLKFVYVQLCTIRALICTF